MSESELDRIRRDPPLRRASDRTPLGNIVGRVEYAFGTGDLAWAAELIEREPLAIWFGFPPERLRDMVIAFADAGIQTGGFIQAMLETLVSDPLDSVGNAPVFAKLDEMIAAQTDPGFAAASLDAGASAAEALAAAELHRGWGLFSAVQHGISEMLAGRFQQALSSFTQARLHAIISPLAFMSRDACVKSAIIHALYGDTELAVLLLNEAETIPRTESWAEPIIDANRVIATSIVFARTAQESMRMLDAVPLSIVGEMWPFHLMAMERALLRAGNNEEIRRRQAEYEGFVLPMRRNATFSRDALASSRSLLSMVQGDLGEARSAIDGADLSIVSTRVLAATLELVSGRPRAALRLTTGMHELTRGLRLLDRWRLAIIAGSHFALGSHDECREVLQHVLGLADPLTPSEVLYFPLEVRRFAEAEVPDWPAAPEAHDGFDMFPSQREVLTARETDVLKELAKGLSREQIAAAQFISLNTLKAHLRSVYRKLNVNSRAAAVLEAERRGIV